MTYIPIRGFAPDYEPTTPGILLDCTDLLPTVKGMEGRPAAVTTQYAALAATCLGAAALRKLDGSTRFFAGTGANLYEASTTTWTTRSRSTSSTYTAVAGTAPWRFAQYNDSSFAANKTDHVQVTNDTTSNFGDISGSIKASICEVVGDFLMLFNTNDPTFGDDPNRWWCSAIGNPASFAPTLATQAASGTLATTAGAISAGRKFGREIVAYKNRSMYLGQYVGPPAVWSWGLITDEIGAPSQEAVIQAMDAHFFLGPQDFYMFDGTRPVSIGDAVREWFYENCDQSNTNLVRGYHDFPRARVWWFFPSTTGGGALDTALVYNYRTQQWGKASLTIEVVTEFVGGGLQYDDFGNTYTTYDDAPLVPYNFPPWLSSASFFSFFDTSHILNTLTGDTGSTMLRTWEMGMDEDLTFALRVRPRYSQMPTSATLVNAWREHQGSTISSASDSITMINGKFDFERSSRWHSVRINAEGDQQILGLKVTGQEDGAE